MFSDWRKSREQTREMMWQLHLTLLPSPCLEWALLGSLRKRHAMWGAHVAEAWHDTVPPLRGLLTSWPMEWPACVRQVQTLALWSSPRTSGTLHNAFCRHVRPLINNKLAPCYELIMCKTAWCNTQIKANARKTKQISLKIINKVTKTHPLNTSKCKTAAPVSGIFWLRFQKTGGSANASTVFMYRLVASYVAAGVLCKGDFNWGINRFSAEQKTFYECWRDFFFCHK